MNLSDEHLMIQDAARKCARDILEVGAEERDKSGAFPRAELTAMGELGLLGVLVPEEFGGVGADHVSLALALEEIAAGDGAISTIMAVQALVCGILMRYGNAAQKQEFLTKLALGEWIGAFALTEAQAGSDAASLATTAVKEGDYYILNGAKQFITSGKHGDVAIVFAVTDRNADKKGLSAFIVPTDTPGYAAPKVEDKMGQKCSDTAQLVFDNVKIPAANRLGEEGEGYKIALSNLEGGRISIAAQSVGMARAAYDEAMRYATERKTFGKMIYDHQAVSFRLAEMATNLQAARLMVLEAARQRDVGDACLKQASMAKLFASEAAEKIASDALQTFGGYGYLKDFAIERIYRDIRVCKIYEGTSDIQKIVIAKELLKQV